MNDIDIFKILSEVKKREEIKKIEIIEKSPCLVEPRRFKISAKADKPLADVLPILHLAIPSSKYSEVHGSLSFLRNGRLVGLFSDGRINASCLEDEREAEDLLMDLKKLINSAFKYYIKHGKPDPKLLELRKKANPLEIYRHLPKTNCGECGEAGCFAFATKLLNGERKLEECPQLQLEKYLEDRAYLERLIKPIRLE